MRGEEVGMEGKREVDKEAEEGRAEILVKLWKKVKN